MGFASKDFQERPASYLSRLGIQYIKHLGVRSYRTLNTLFKRSSLSAVQGVLDDRSTSALVLHREVTAGGRQHVLGLWVKGLAGGILRHIASSAIRPHDQVDPVLSTCLVLSRLLWMLWSSYSPSQVTFGE